MSTVYEKYKEAIELLNENNNYYGTLLEKQSEYDKKTDYWLHFIEDSSIDAFTAYRIIKEIKKIRKERRLIKNDIEIMKLFKENEGKLCHNDNRNILLNQITKTNNRQVNWTYVNDAYTEEELVDILKIEKEKLWKKKKETKEK